MLELPVFNIQLDLNGDVTEQPHDKLTAYSNLIGNSLSEDDKAFVMFEINEWIEKIVDYHNEFEQEEPAEYHKTSCYPRYSFRITIHVARL